MSEQTFKQHAVVELFGHNQIAGLVTEQAIGGATFVRVDVPKTSARAAFTKFFGAGAIYAITPVDESVAAKMAEALEVAPVQEWRLKELTGGADVPRLPVGWEDPDNDDFDSREHWDDDTDDDEAEEDKVEVPYLTLEEQAENAHNQDKAAAAQWARELLAGEFVVVDTETTGLGEDAEIVSIAIVDQAGDVLLSSLVKPSGPIPFEAVRIHGIADAKVEGAPTFSELYPLIRDAIGAKKLIAYNHDFDRRMLDQTCRRYGLTEFANTGDCAMLQYAAFNGDWNDYHGNYRWVNLREALSHVGLKHEDFGEGAHSAVTDAKATLALIKKMAEWWPEEKA